MARSLPLKVWTGRSNILLKPSPEKPHYGQFKLSLDYRGAGQSRNDLGPRHVP